MTHFKHLLAATDLSAPARHAANRAAMVAKETAATLDLIHVASMTPLEKLKRLVTDIPVELEQRVIERSKLDMMFQSRAPQPFVHIIDLFAKREQTIIYEQHS